MRRRLISLMLLLVLWAGSSVAVAQPTGDELQSYEDYLQRGSKAFEAKDFETALFLFAKAQEIHDHPRLRFSMARIYEELHQCVAAKMLFTLLMENDATPEELRKESGFRLANIEECGERAAAAHMQESAAAEPQEADALLAVDIEEPVRSAATSRNLRNIGVWSIGIGAAVTTAGIVVAFGTFVPRVHRECFGLREVSLDAQMAACESIAEGDEDFIAAHTRSRAVVQQHRIASTAMLAAGVAGSAVGLGLFYFDRNKRTAVHVTPTGAAFSYQF